MSRKWTEHGRQKPETGAKTDEPGAAGLGISAADTSAMQTTRSLRDKEFVRLPVFIIMVKAESPTFSLLDCAMPLA
jgi:hypothetical protein